VPAQEPPAAKEPAAARERPVVLSIEVQGAERYTPQRLIEALGQDVGAPLDPARIETGIENLWDVFHVRASAVKVREEEGGVHLRLVVVEMPVDLEPRFIGNAKIKTEELLDWAHIGAKRELYLHEADRVESRILEGYRREGYYFAEVDAIVQEPGLDAEGEPIPADVIFRIQEGPRVRVRSVQVHGNRAFPDRGFWLWRDGLKKQAGLELRGPSLFNWSGQPFVEQVLQADLIAMRQVYRERGFLDAVVEIDRLEFSQDRARVRVHVIVDEGEPFTVASLGIEAVEEETNPAGPGAEPLYRPVDLVFPEEELLGKCALQPGRRYEKVRVDADLYALRDYYGARGYLAHRSLGQNESWEFVEPRLTFDVERREVSVVYRIVQGRQKRIREVLFSGATHTRDRVLRREVQMLEGQQADLEKILLSLRELTGTGYFTDPRDRLSHPDPTYRFVPTDDPGWVDLEFMVEEGRVVDFNVAGGVDSNAGFFGLVSLRMRNFDITDLPRSFASTLGEIYRKEAFHGAGQRLEIQYSPGNERSFTRLFFLEPDLFRSHFDPTSGSFEFRDQDRFYDDYDEGLRSRGIRLGQRYGVNWTVFAGFTDKDIGVSDLPQGVPLPQELADQEGRSSFRGLGFDVQYRDLDNRLDPKDGREVLWRNEYWGSFLGGDNEFYMTTLSWDEYWPIGTDTLEVRPSMELSLGAGYASAFGDSRSVPYTERLFLGGIGSNQLRGFDFRGVGPNVGEIPIGGEAMLRANLEYRHPLYSVTRPGTYRKVEMLRLKFFLDAGVLGTSAGDLSLDDYRASYGFGFGLAQPFPITFNFGWPLKKGPGDDLQVFSFHLELFGF